MASVKSTLVLLIVGCIILNVNARPKAVGMECVPGKTFYDGCNNCGCSSDGYVTICTQRACLSDPPTRIEKQ